MGFDINQWMKHCELFEKNKKGLDFKVSCKFEDGNLKLFFRDLDDKYKKTVTKLGSIICQGFITYMHLSINPAFYAPEEDVPDEVKKTEQMISENTETALRLLLQNGHMGAISFFITKMNLIRIEYESSHFQFKNGNWVNAKGEIFDNGQFVTDSGERYTDMLSDVWTSVIQSAA